MSTSFYSLPADAGRSRQEVLSEDSIDDYGKGRRARTERRLSFRVGDTRQRSAGRDRRTTPGGAVAGLNFGREVVQRRDVNCSLQLSFDPVTTAESVGPIGPFVIGGRAVVLDGPLQRRSNALALRTD